MALDPSIILSGQPVNVLGALSAGNTLAAQTNDMQRRNALAQLYQQQGAGIMAGDPGALNALAQYDPQAALGIRQTQQSMAFDAEKLGMLRDQAKAAAAEHAAQMDKKAKADAAAKLESGLKGAAYFYQKGDRAGYDNFIRQQGLDSAEFTFDNFPAHAAQVSGVLDVLKSFAPADPTKGAPEGTIWNDPKDPRKGVSPIPGYSPKAADDYQRYVQEEKTAGRQPLDRIGFETAKKGKGFSVTTADGTTVQYGGGNDPVATAQHDQAQISADVVTGKIAEAKGLVTNSGGWLPTTGFAGQQLMNTGGTAANDLRGTLATIKANVAFDKLAQIRAASKTGGALGAVSDREMELLSSALTSLDQTQSPEQLMKNLNNLEVIYKTITEKLNAYPGQGAQASPGAASGATDQGGLPADLQGVFDKYKN